jgi:hypothetical protein
MPKKDEQQAKGDGRVKFRYADADRYFDLDVDGIKNEGGVVDGLKSIANALAGRVLNTNPNRTLAPKPPAGNGTVITPPTPEDEPLEEEIAEEEAVAEDTTNGNGVPKTRKKYPPKAPTLLSNLDFASAKVSLEDFVATKDTAEVSDKYVVVATWFKEQMGLDEITIDHIFTAFRLLNWPVPDDLGNQFRMLKHKKQYFDKGDSVGGYKVTFLATNYVSKMGTK